MRFLKLSVIFFFIFFHFSAYSQTDTRQQIQKIFNTWRVRSGIPGAALSINAPSADMAMNFNSGTKTFRGDESVHSETLYQAGSITKSFTSTLILKLESEGKLNIDDSITDYLPQYSQWRNVTIRQLLNHTSGIFNYTDTGVFNQIRKSQPRAAFTPAQLVNMASRHRGYFSPGNGWKYSNTNYVLAGMIVERITGKPVNQAMEEGLKLRLNLPNTYYASGSYSGNLLARMAHGYNRNGMDSTYDNMSWAYTAGAIVTTTQDLLAWWKGLFQGAFLPPTQMQKMTSLICEGGSRYCMRGEPISPFHGYEIGKGYGLGVIQSSYGSKIGTVWWHNGSTRGYKAIVMWFPKYNIYMALAINRDPGYLLKPNMPMIRRVLNTLIYARNTKNPNPKMNTANATPRKK